MIGVSHTPTFLFVLGLVYATSAIVIFFRDLTQIISIFLQVGVLLTPIMWDINMLSSHPWLIKLFKLNPMYKKEGADRVINDLQCIKAWCISVACT